MRCRPSGISAVRLLVALILAVASRPALADEIVLNCYLFQSGSGSSGQFVRRIEVDTQAGTVAIADDTTRSGFKPLGAYGKVVTVDDDSIVFDFSSSRSSGRTTIDRHAGTYAFTDGRIVLRGTCSPSNF